MIKRISQNGGVLRPAPASARHGARRAAAARLRDAPRDTPAKIPASRRP
jgi:hypothetical protein